MTQLRVCRKWVVLIERLVAMVIGWCTGLVCDGATADGLCARHRTISFAVSDVSHLCDAHYVYCFLVCLTSPEKVPSNLPSSGSDLREENCRLCFIVPLRVKKSTEEGLQWNVRGGSFKTFRRPIEYREMSVHLSRSITGNDQSYGTA